MKKFPTLIDGGFLIWTYGPDEHKQAGWQHALWRFTKQDNNTIILDGGSTFRREFYPQYKQHRRDRRAADPERQARTDRVMHFKDKVIAPDTRLQTIVFPDMEADDIIAAWAIRWKHGPMKVIGTDKDLLQLGKHIDLWKHNGQHVTVESFASRLQKTIKDFVDTPEKILLVITMLGDKSDDVPRIVPPGIKALREFARVLTAPNPWKSVVEMYDKKLIERNLYLTILPGPWSYALIPTPEQVLEVMQHDPGIYYNQPLRKDIEDKFMELLGDEEPLPEIQKIPEEIRW